MNEEELKKMINDSYDQTREESLGNIIKTFYSRKMRWVAVMLWTWALVGMTLITLSVVFFFQTDETRLQIMWATVFICSFTLIGFVKEMAWGVVNKHLLSREIKRLELEVAQLSQSIEKSREG